jgi:tricorn protease
LTSGYFVDQDPVFDAKGEYIYFHSNRSFNSPEYDDIGTSFIYAGTDVLMAMPLKADFEHPMLPKVDEEEWEDEKEDEEEEKESGEKNAEDKEKDPADEDAKDAGDKDADEDKEGDDK